MEHSVPVINDVKNRLKTWKMACCKCIRLFEMVKQVWNIMKPAFGKKPYNKDMKSWNKWEKDIANSCMHLRFPMAWAVEEIIQRTQPVINMSEMQLLTSRG